MAARPGAARVPDSRREGETSEERRAAYRPRECVGDQGGRRQGVPATRRLTRDVDLAKEHLAYLTWARPSIAQAAKESDNIGWLFVQMVVDVATVLAAWVRHATSEMPH